MDAIAGLSGVSKATVYKHWANKDALLSDLIKEQTGKLPEFDSGNARADLTDLLRHLARKRKPEQIARIWPRIVGYAVSNADFRKALQSVAFQPRRAQIDRILKQAGEPGGRSPRIAARLAIDHLARPNHVR